MDEILEEGSVLELEPGMDLESFIEENVISIQSIKYLVYRKDQETVGAYFREEGSADIIAIDMEPILNTNPQKMNVFYREMIPPGDTIYDRINKRLLKKGL